MSELPYQAEYAKSGRASCKSCKQKIEQGSLRLAAMVQSAFFDGKQANWYHGDCFFLKQRPQSVDDIGKFNTLKNSDQKHITETIAGLSSVVIPVEKTKGKGKGKGTKRGASSSDNAALKDFAVEYSKSSRATCKVCDIKICKGEVRICKTVYDSEVGKKFGGQPLWHHVKCFAEARNDLLYLASGEDLPGFKSLSKDDQKMVKEELPPIKSDELPIKKLKEEPVDENAEKNEKELEKQNKLFQKHRKALSGYAKNQLQELLAENSHHDAKGKDDCLDLLADIMTFGALEHCPECKDGQFVLDNQGYKCQGNISEWTKCTYITQSPKRVPMIVPEKFKDDSAFKKYKPKVGVRLFRSAPKPQFVVIKKEDPEDVKKEKRMPPLKNLEFFIYGKMETPKEELKKRILKLGGKVASRFSNNIAAVISTKKEIDKMPAKMMDIRDEDVEVVDENFLDLIDADTGTVAKSLELIKENNIASWGSDPATRVPQDVIDGKSMPKSGSIYTKSSKSGPTKLKLQGGTAVDPDSGLDDVAHVYKSKDGTKYTVVLGQTDVVAQKNSFYKMQVLEADNQKRYWLFRAWGRIGTTIGGNKVDNCKTLYDAINKFEEHFLEKTENSFKCIDKFKKVPGRYCPIDVDYGDEEQHTVKLVEDTSCSLHMSVQKLIMQIFDIDNMKKTLLEFELDTEKMPLGKLSKNQIKSGFKVLSELLKHIEKGAASRNKIIDATNQFYTLIPHSFGIENPPLLDSVEAINTKSSMLDNLLEIEIAYSLLKTDTKESSTHSPVEAHYMKLKTTIAPLEQTSSEYELLVKYVQNTHAATHSQYTLDIEQIFKVVREGEDKRYKPFKKLHNRRLLWHGSRVTNFAGILSQGLRIAPPEAPVTGYMFGKGIYFADMVSKSANYCCTDKSNPGGIMLLCEVALGDTKECHQSEYVTKLPAGKHSVWGRGRTMPDPKLDHTLDDGTIIPLGTPVDTKIQTVLLYNEFIVYDVAQVNVKYLLQMKFNHKY